MFLYTALNLMISLTVRISGGRIEPDNYDMKEYWTWKAPGRKPWFVRAFRNATYSAKDMHKSSPQTFNAHGGLDCEMLRVASSDERKDDARVSVSVPVPALSRCSR
jgi:AGZA family xanthine/uracil permease-like MFS transporter